MGEKGGSKVDAKVMKKTQDTLGKIITKPPLTEKLLSKPPFRFLHDVMTSVVKTTGFMKGLYTNNEQSSENVKDKDSKIAFLQKAFDMVSLATGKPIPAKPSKIVAGHEPERTNEFLQMLAEAINKKVDNDEYVQRVLKGDSGGGKPPAGKEKRERTDRDKDKKRDEKDRDRKRDRDDDKEKRHRSKDRDGDDRKGRSEREKGKDRERSKDRDRERSREKSSDRRHRDRDRDSDKKDRKDDSGDQHKDRERKKREKEEKQEGVTQQSEDGDKEPEGQEETKARRPRPNSAKGSRRRHGHGKGGEESEEDEEERRPAEKTRGQKSERDESKMNGTIGEDDLPPQVAAARKMARPSSARPAPPKLKKNEPGNEPAMIVGSGNVPNVITDKDDSDDDDIFITKDEPTVTEPEPQHQPEDEDEAGEHGGLVKKILETKKELEGGSQTQQAPKKTEIERSHVNDAQKRKERDMMQKDIDRLRGSIQTLTRSVNPLGKIMDFLQEDLDSMQKELEVWKKENKTNSVALQREQSITESSIEPLKAQLQELDQAINDQLDLIAAVKCNIIRDDDKIEKMLSTLTKS